jgi:hypothetical protein
MKNPDDRSPAEWAEEARERIADTDPDIHHRVWLLTADDCEELAQRMDDLGEALRLLREAQFWVGTKDHHAASVLLTKYHEEDGQ